MEAYKELTIKDAKSLEQWAKITIERWETRISKLNIYSTGALLKSFHHQVLNDAGGNVEKIMFTFEYYGRFPDMGVGNGVPYSKVNMSNRKAKPWYSKIFINECNFLAKMFATRYGKMAANSFQIIENNNKRNYGKL